MIALQPPLVQAIFNRNAEEVQLLLHKKEDVNALVCTMYMNFHCITGWYHEGLVPCNIWKFKRNITLDWSLIVYSTGPRAPYATSCCCLCGWRPYNGPPHWIRWVSCMHYWYFNAHEEFGLLWLLYNHPNRHPLIVGSLQVYCPCDLQQTCDPLWLNCWFFFLRLPGATVNAKDHVWLTPLHRAAASRNEVSKKLISFCHFKQSNYLSVRWLHPLILLCIHPQQL